MKGATASADGSVGYVNAVPPKDGYNTKYLRADGSWAVPPNTNTTYTANTGIKLNGNIFQHTNAVTAGTAQGDANKTLTWGGTFTIPTVSYDAQGHITGKGTTTMTMPANPNTAYTAGRGLALSGNVFSLASGCTAVSDWNNATSTGFYTSQSATASNQPVSNAWFIGEAIAYNNSYLRQIVYRYSVDTKIDGTNNDRYERVCYNGTWGSWINTSVRVAVPSNAKFTDTVPTSLKNPNSLVIKLNGGTTEGTNIFTYDGSAAKLINITPSSIGAAPSSHSHTKSQITDFPTSMPASDVSAWAKATTKPSYVWSEIGNKPTGDASTLGITKLYTSTGDGTDGTITQHKLTELFDDVNDDLNAAIDSVIDTINKKQNENDVELDKYATIVYVESEDTKLRTDITNKYDLLSAKDDEIIQMIKDTNDSLDISDYIRFVDGLLEMGYSTNTYIQKNDNNKIAFYQGDTIIASIHDNKIESNNVKVTNSIIIGDDTNGFFELSMDSTAGLVMR